MMFAAQGGRRVLVEAMLAFRPDLAIKNGKGMTALDFARSEENHGIIQILERAMTHGGFSAAGSPGEGPYPGSITAAAVGGGSRVTAAAAGEAIAPVTGVLTTGGNEDGGASDL